MLQSVRGLCTDGQQNVWTLRMEKVHVIPLPFPPQHTPHTVHSVYVYMHKTKTATFEDIPGSVQITPCKKTKEH